MKRMAAAQAMVVVVMAAAGCSPVRSGTDEFARPAAEVRARDPAAVAEAVIRSRDVGRRVDYLASDALRGRDTPSPGLDTAAAYLASEFEGMGLAAAGTDGYLQRWPLQRRVLDADRAHLEFRVGETRRVLEYGADYAAIGGGSAVQSEVVFVGRAEDAPQAMAAGADRIALVLLAGERPADWRWPVTVGRTARAAVRARVGAVVFVLAPDFEAASLSAAVAAFEQPTANGSQVPLFFVRYGIGEDLYRSAGVDLRRMWGGGPARTMPGMVAAADAPLRDVDVQVPNVVAVAPGSDPDRAEEYVVLSAHFDHVGVGSPDASGDSIYNGADDNASGTAALLEVAQAFAALDEAPARPVLFLALAGEEKGLLGSQWFAANPTVFLTDAVANVNLDMIGRNEPGGVVVVGQSYSSLGPLFDSLAVAHPELGLRVIPDPHPGERFFTRSDQYNFALRGIPSVLVTTHLHEDYHSPADEAARVDTDKVARIARLVFLAALELAGGRDVQWTEEGRAAVRRR